MKMSVMFLIGIGSWESIPGLLKRLQIQAQATLASRIGSLESIPGLLKRLQLWVQATLDSKIFSLESIPGLFKHLQTRAQATLASRIGSLESIPGLSLSPFLETFKEPRNWFQGTRKPWNQEPRTDSPYRRVGESPTPRISESGSRYLIYNKLQNFISQKITKAFWMKF